MSVGIRDLKNRASEILRELEVEGTSVVVTRHGRPTALILPMDSPEAEDYVLSHAPQIVTSLREAEGDLRSGKTISLKTYKRRKGL
ncbi:MAG TPA: type II toxin-antitoxin system Phd/YefM family antitoxin [Actinomycetota bacterium]|nr:type II toxin-antitoxin system Phd/YefM family antitoxin [Actinomycetota bacterium]